ncbi:MAG: hypothetical protein IPN53_13235 [Comamonadaceae bacterium]|nr:hypothetical protein [Comamonadaceae bacterium]
MTMSRNKPSMAFWTDAGRAVLLVLILLQLSWTTAANAAGWSTAPSMMTLRAYHTSTLLPNGKVLVVGGINGSGVLDSPEVFDPATGLWSSAGSMSILRQGHTATLLPNGKVLVMGGKDGAGLYLSSFQLYDPATNAWSAAISSTIAARWNHTATLLPSGKVLVVGGYAVRAGVISYLTSTALYDPVANTWSSVGLVGSLNTGRETHTATVLPNGKVLVAGGKGSSGSLASAEAFDPATNVWSLIAGSLTQARYSHTATLLPNGKVLFVSGAASASVTRNSAELYDPASGWSSAGTLTARHSHSATLLPSGKVLIVGGSDPAAMNSAQLYDPDGWSSAGTLAAARYAHTATLLSSGQVLAAGGYGAATYLASVDMYDAGFPGWGSAGSLSTGRQNHTATLLPNTMYCLPGVPMAPVY